MMNGYVGSLMLLLVILNPFALSVCLFEVLRKHALNTIAAMLWRAVVIADSVLGVFALGGERSVDSYDRGR